MASFSPIHIQTTSESKKRTVFGKIRDRKFDTGTAKTAFALDGVNSAKVHSQGRIKPDSFSLSIINFGCFFLQSVPIFEFRKNCLETTRFLRHFRSLRPRSNRVEPLKETGRSPSRILPFRPVTELSSADR